MSKKYQLLINSKNKDKNVSNKFVYQFPSNIFFEDTDRIGLASISIYNSFFNITETLQNNKITISWLGTIYNWIIPDGNYNANQLNYWLQSKMAFENLCLITSTGKIVYYIEIGTQPEQYAISLTVYPIPTATEASDLGYVQPSGATWSFPVSAETPLFTITDEFSTLIGFNLGTYPSNVQSITQIILSSTAPQLSPSNSMLITCNLINSKFSQVPNILTSVPLKANFGSLIDTDYPSPTLLNIAPGYYSELTLNFFDQNFKALPIIDNDVIIRIVLDISNK